VAYTIAIIGAGWYGCHLATSFDALGMDVKVFEMNTRPLHEASGNNQFRLHLGFHYARHYNTRMQSRDGYMRFIERYPSLSGHVVNNIYAVPKHDSLIDFLTYRLIMTSSGLDFSEKININLDIKNIEGYLITEERVLHTETARSYFKQRLADKLILNERISSIEEKSDCCYVNGERFDYVIDATWGHFTKPPMDVIYEPTILLYYESLDKKNIFPALTFVDGPLCSIYPTEEPTLYTLSSVPYTPVGRYATASEARVVKNKLNETVVLSKVKQMEEQIAHYVPDFRDRFRFVGPQFAIKTKPTSSHDDRSCHVFKQGRIFSVMSGKIDTVFFASERILSTLESIPDSQFVKTPSLLMKEINDMANG